MASKMIIARDDCGFLYGSEFPELPTQEDLVKRVGLYADTGIDALSFDLIGGQLASYDSKVCEPPPPTMGRESEVVKYLIDTGVDVAAVVAEACHRRGLQYWPGARMNASATYLSRTHEEHPDWFLWSCPVRGVNLDYGNPEVRAFMLSAFREMVEDYDADGLLLDFVRYWDLFDRDHAVENTDLLTQYVGEIHQMLHEVAVKKGKDRLPLAVQVLSRPAGGLAYGHDVSAWMQEGYVDWVMPSRPNHTDYSMPVDQWVELARGTDCLILPALHPGHAYPFGTVENRMTLDNARAAAYVYYQQGADGLSTMNMLDVGFSEWFKILRDPKQVARGRHHYRYTLMPMESLEYALSWPIGVALAARMLPMLLYYEPEVMERGTLRLTLTNLSPEDEPEFICNGELLPKRDLGTSVGYFRIGSDSKEGQPATWRYEFPLNSARLRRGENLIGCRLVKGAAGFGPATLREVEVLIELDACC